MYYMDNMCMAWHIVSSQFYINIYLLSITIINVALSFLIVSSIKKYFLSTY